MIDFQNAAFLNLRPVPLSEAENALTPLLLNGETIIGADRTVRDMVIFTDKRIVSINVQGITGKKKDYTSLPYSNIQCWSVETAGVLDLDSELDLWFSGLGRVRFEFRGSVDIRAISQTIAGYVLR